MKSIIEEISLGESKTLEFKLTLPKHENLAKTIIAFANTSGGKIILGVDDNKNIIGIDDKEIFSIQDTISSIINDSCFPDILVDYYIQNIDNRLLLIINVHRGALLPYYYKKHGVTKGVYFRLGATNRLASEENIAELLRQKSKTTYDNELIYDIDYKTLDVEPLYGIFKLRNKELNTEKLLNLKLLQKYNDRILPSKAMFIALGIFDNCTIQCARFKGLNKTVFIDNKTFSGNIFSLLDNSLNFILNHILNTPIINHLYREDTYEIPVIALREALVNALVHRDYTGHGKNIKIEIYDDRLDIISPGSLPSGLLLEDIYLGRSEIRNRVVANMFKELGMIEQWGSGISRIMDSCKIHGLKSPYINEKNDFFIVSFYRQNISSNTNKNNIHYNSTEYDRIRPNLTKSDRTIYTTDIEAEELVLQYLNINYKITNLIIQQLLNYKVTKTKNLLKKMIESQKLLKLGKGKNTYYILSNNK